MQVEPLFQFIIVLCILLKFLKILKWFIIIVSTIPWTPMIFIYLQIFVNCICSSINSSCHICLKLKSSCIKWHGNQLKITNSIWIDQYTMENCTELCYELIFSFFFLLYVNVQFWSHWKWQETKERKKMPFLNVHIH